MNDLHTADLAMQVAERLDSHALVNRGCDRNDVDLNRIRQLVAKAPFFLAQLRARVDEIVAHGERPLVLLVHGWNMAVPWCDVGVGLRDRGGTLYGRFPTVGRDRYASFVEPLAARLFEVGLGACIGLRYPAAGRDNATQLFSGRHVDHDDDDVAALAALAADERVDAVQLELGIPLRWRGWRREAFIDALVQCVREEEPYRAVGEPADTVRSDAWGLEAKPPHSLPAQSVPGTQAAPDSGCSLQAVLDDGTGLFLGAEPTGPATMATRVCVALVDGSMLLFVGEGPWDGVSGRYQIAGFRWQSTGNAESAPSRVGVRLDGPLVHYRTHEAFVDLERGLSGADLADADIELEYIAAQGGVGRLVGHVRVGAIERAIDVWAVCQRGGRRASMPGDKLDVFMVEAGVAPVRVLDLRGPSAAAQCVRFIDGESGDTAQLEVMRDGEIVFAAETPVKVPVYRLLPDGRVVCVTFGTVGPRVGDASGAVGLYERVEITPRVDDCDEH